MKRPSRFSLFCLIVGTLCSTIDLWTWLTEALFVLPIYGVGILTIVWTDYLLITVPVSMAWLALGVGTWRLN